MLALCSDSMPWSIQERIRKPAQRVGRKKEKIYKKMCAIPRGTTKGGGRPTTFRYGIASGTP
jgi:hypothetical protein